MPDSLFDLRTPGSIPVADRPPATNAGTVTKVGPGGVRSDLTFDAVSPVSGTLEEVLARARAEAQVPAGLTPVPLGTPPLAPMAPISVDALPAESRRAFDRMAAAPAQVMTSGADERANAYLSNLSAAIAGNRPEAAIDPAPGVVRQAAPPTDSPALDPDLVPVAEVKFEGPASTGAAPTPSVLCDHCGWGAGRPDPTEPTEVDKYDFLAAMLGGTRFIRTFSLLGGALSGSFRTRTCAESDEVIRQIAADNAAGRAVPGAASYFQLYVRYTLAMSLDSIVSGLGKAASIPVFADVPVDPGVEKLPALVDRIEGKLLVASQVRYAVAGAFEEFERLVAKLEVRMSDPDFWRGIAPRG